MSQIKIILALFLGFAVPVVFAVYIGPRLFSHSDRTGYTAVDQELQPRKTPRTEVSARMLRIERGGSYASVPHDASLDPAPDKAFIVAFMARFDELPRVGKREILLVKYAAEKPPHAGWGISMRRRDTSLRPEVYWVGPDGQGGWYSFDALDLRPGVWYSFAAVVKPGEFMNFFVEELPAEGDAAGAKHALPAFFGGYELARVPAPSSASELSIGATQPGPNAFSGSLGLVLIAQVDTLPKKRSQLIELLSGSPQDISSRIPPESISLWIGPDGTDQSRFHRQIALNGSAIWQKM